jgi:hypothetical protein
MVVVASAGVALAAPSLVSGAGGGLISKMNGKQVVPAGSGAPNGKGNAAFKVRAKRQRLCFEITFRRTQGPVRGYIFRGKRGQEPPNPNKPAVTLFGELEASPVAGCVPVNQKRLKRLKNKPRRFHVVLVNERYPEGAVRGQLRPGN